MILTTMTKKGRRLKMLFKPEMRQQILLGNKTVTRRPKKFGEEIRTIWEPDNTAKTFITTAKGNVKIMTGRNYAVPFAYLKPTAWWNKLTGYEMEYEKYLTYKQICNNDQKSLYDRLSSYSLYPFRIKVLALDSEPVHLISEEQAGNPYEGFGDEGIFGFWSTYIGFYKKSALKQLAQINDVGLGREYVQSLNLPDAWVITFDPPQNFMLDEVK